MIYNYKWGGEICISPWCHRDSAHIWVQSHQISSIYNLSMKIQMPKQVFAQRMAVGRQQRWQMKHTLSFWNTPYMYGHTAHGMLNATQHIVCCAQCWHMNSELCKMSLQNQNYIWQCWCLFYTTTTFWLQNVTKPILNHLWSKMNHFDLPWANAIIFQDNSGSSRTVYVRSILGYFKVD